MLGLHGAVPLGRFIHGSWRWLGFVPAISGLVINLVADNAFKRVKTTVKPYGTSSTLVTDGVFRLSRNPMYLGMLLMLLGLWLYLGTVSPFFPIPIFTILMDRVFIRPEEAMLRTTFGDQYEAYRHTVRRWI